MHISGRVVGMFLGGLLAQSLACESFSLFPSLLFLYFFSYPLSFCVSMCVCARVCFGRRGREVCGPASQLLFFFFPNHTTSPTFPNLLACMQERVAPFWFRCLVLCCAVSYRTVLFCAVPFLAILCERGRASTLLLCHKWVKWSFPPWANRKFFIFLNLLDILSVNVQLLRMFFMQLKHWVFLLLV